MSETLTLKNNTFKAVTATLTGFFFLASVGLFVKLEIKGGASIEWIVFMQYLVSLFIITLIASRNNFLDLKTTKFRYHLIRGVFGVMAFTLFVSSVSEIPLVNANLLFNTTPIFIPVISMIWLKSKINKKIWWGILIGFTGIIIILDPKAGGFLKTGDLNGLGAGFSLAVAYVAMSILTKSESFITIIFYYSLIAFTLSIPFAFTNWSNPPLLIWIYAILTGLFFISYLYLLQYAYRFVPAVKLSPFNFSVIIFAGILDWIVFDTVPGLSTYTGIIFVSLGGILSISNHEKNNKHLKHHWHF